MNSHRKDRLRRLIARKFQGDRGQLISQSGLSKGRITQLLDPEEPFGERAARSLERTLQLPPRWFDGTDDLDAKHEAQASIELQQLIDDYNALPDGLREFIANKANETRAYYESLTPMFRKDFGSKKNDARRLEWERDVEADMAARRMRDSQK